MRSSPESAPSPSGRERPASARVRKGSGHPPGVAQVPAQKTDHALRQIVGPRVAGEFLGVYARREQVQREIPHDLAGWGDLHQTPEQPVAAGVQKLDLLEAVAEAQRDRLLAQVGELPTRDLVPVDGAGRRAQPRLEGGVEAAHRLPVGLHVPKGIQREPGRAPGVVGGGDDRRETGLAGHPGERSRRPVHGVHPGLDGRKIGGELPTCGVVGVQVYRQVEPLAQRAHEGAGGRGPQQPGHVLYAQNVAAGIDQLLGQPQVVVEGVEFLAGI